MPNFFMLSLVVILGWVFFFIGRYCCVDFNVCEVTARNGLVCGILGDYFSVLV